MIIIPVISFVMIACTLYLSIRAEKAFNDFVEEYSDGMLFMIKKSIPHKFCTVIAVGYWCLIIFLYIFGRYNPRAYVYTALICSLAAFLCIRLMIHGGTWCIVFHPQKMIINRFLGRATQISTDSLIDFRQKDQKKYVIASKETKVKINSEGVRMITRRDDGTLIEEPLYTSELMFDDNPILNYMESWGNGND